MAEALQNVVNVAAQAAQAAASAALSLEALAKAKDKEDKGTRYGEASKVIRMPDPFGSDLGDVETDQARWSGGFSTQAPSLRLSWSMWRPTSRLR